MADFSKSPLRPCGGEVAFSFPDVHLVNLRLAKEPRAG